MKHEHNKSMMRAPYNFSLKLQIIFIAHEMSIKCYHFLCPLYLNTVFFLLRSEFLFCLFFSLTIRCFHSFAENLTKKN